MRYTEKKTSHSGSLDMHIGKVNETITRVIILKTNTNIVLMCVGKRCYSYSVSRQPSTLLLVGGL